MQLLHNDDLQWPENLENLHRTIRPPCVEHLTKGQPHLFREWPDLQSIGYTNLWFGLAKPSTGRLRGRCNNRGFLLILPDLLGSHCDDLVDDLTRA